jgi:peptidoglycan/xylan/chitin deacetylase (PgdA/CDA1 family)
MWYSGLVWNMDRQHKNLYLTFDDGPHETATPFVLDTLQQFNAKATFFCIGKNVAAYPHIYERILTQRHTTGNHTYNHLNGWNTAADVYLQDINRTAQLVQSPLFRPPYGRISRLQSKLLRKTGALQRPAFDVVMWDVLSGDFDTTMSGEQCLKNVLLHAQNGSIVVFHDSAKAWDRLHYALPRVLQYFTEKGFVFKALPA